MTFDLRENRTTVHTNGVEPWRVTLVDTGDKTMTGGRIKRARDYIGDETFCLTYGDCVGNIDVNALLEVHRKENALVTVTAVQPPGRFGALATRRGRESDRRVRREAEGRRRLDQRRLLRRRAGGCSTTSTATRRVWEQEPLQRLAADGRLAAYRHRGYWQPLDTLRDKMFLEQEWQSGIALVEGVVAVRDPHHRKSRATSAPSLPAISATSFPRRR